MNLSPFFKKLKTLKKKIKYSSLKLLHLIIFNLFQTRQKKEIAEIRSILVFGYTGIGNLILYTPALKLLRNKYPRAHILFQYGNNTNCEKILKNSDLINEFHEIKINSSIFDFIKFGFHNRNNIDLVIMDFHIDKIRFLFELLFMNPAIIIGNERTENFPFLSTHHIPLSNQDHEIEIYLNSLKPLKIEFNREKEFTNTEVFITEENRNFASNLLKALPDHKKNIGLQIGTNIKMNWKQWPIEYFVSLIKMLNSLSVNIILVGSPAEKTMLEELIESNNLENVYNFAGMGTLLDSCALISKLDFMITNDSGLMHVSNSFKTPLLAIYGPTNHRRTSPLCETSHIIKNSFDCIPCFEFELKPCNYNRRCLRKLTPDIVFNKLKELLLNL